MIISSPPFFWISSEKPVLFFCIFFLLLRHERKMLHSSFQRVLFRFPSEQTAWNPLIHFLVKNLGKRRLYKEKRREDTAWWGGLYMPLPQAQSWACARNQGADRAWRRLTKFFFLLPRYSKEFTWECFRFESCVWKEKGPELWGAKRSKWKNNFQRFSGEIAYWKKNEKRLH